MGYEFFGGKIIVPSTPVPGINNDQSLNVVNMKYAGMALGTFILFLKMVTSKHN